MTLHLGCACDGWTHVMCLACWAFEEGDRQPTRLRDDDEHPCCFCGRPTSSGIYVRRQPNRPAAG